MVRRGKIQITPIDFRVCRTQLHPNSTGQKEGKKEKVSRRQRSLNLTHFPEETEVFEEGCS